MYEGFAGEVKTFFVRGLMFPNEEVFSSSLAHGAVGSVGCSSPQASPSSRKQQVPSAFRRFPSTM